MPNQLYYKNISIEDFNKKFDEIETLSEKFEFIADYLLSYGFEDEDAIEKQNTNVVNLMDSTAEKFIHNAREKFLEASLKSREEYNKTHNIPLNADIIDPSLDPNSEEQKGMQKFMLDPANYLSRCAKIAKKEYSNPENVTITSKVDYDEWLRNLDRVSREFHSVSKVFDANEKNRNVLDLLNSVKKECNITENVTYNDVLKKHSGGFFEKVFNTTSKEYKNFQKAFKEYNDKDNPNYSNDEKLEKAAREYIHHKIPNFKIGDLPDKEDIERFSGTSKARLEFCVGVLKSIEQRFQRTQMTDLIRSNEIIANQNKENNIQDNFQNDLNNQIEKEAPAFNPDEFEITTVDMTKFNNNEPEQN